MYEEVARANNWSSRSKLDIVPVYLQEGYAPRTWFRQNRYQWEDAERGEAWEGFLWLFVRRFENDAAKDRVKGMAAVGIVRVVIFGLIMIDVCQ